MYFDWQLIVTALIVAAAAWHVGRVIARQVAGFRRTTKAGASGCSGCEAGKTAKTPQLITLSAAPLRRIVVPATRQDESAGK